MRKVNKKLGEKTLLELRRARKKTIYTSCSSSVNAGLFKGLVEPTSVVPVTIEGIHVKALIDSGSQVIFYRSFYNTYLKHLAIQRVWNSEKWE